MLSFSDQEDPVVSAGKENDLAMFCSATVGKVVTTKEVLDLLVEIGIMNQVYYISSTGITEYLCYHMPYYVKTLFSVVDSLARDSAIRGPSITPYIKKLKEQKEYDSLRLLDSLV